MENHRELFLFVVVNIKEVPKTEGQGFESKNLSKLNMVCVGYHLKGLYKPHILQLTLIW